MELKNLSLPSRLFFAAAGLMILFSFFQTIGQLNKVIALRRANPFVFGGEKFEGIKDLVQGEKYVGYITDKDFKIDKNTAEFSQAQFALVPVILDLNNPDHRLLLINCDSPQKAIAFMKQYGARPIRGNNLGTILAVRENL
jgi:hypothetical protein